MSDADTNYLSALRKRRTSLKGLIKRRRERIDEMGWDIHNARNRLAVVESEIRQHLAAQKESKP